VLFRSLSRIRRGQLLVGAAFALLVGASAPTGVARMQVDSFSVNYIGTSSLRLTGPSGGGVPSGGSIPAGQYQVLVFDDDYMTPRFQISGPGVNVNDDLNSTGMGIDHPAYLGPFQFQAGATYTVRDVNMGASLTFSTTAGGSSSSGGSSSGGTSSGGTSSGGSTSSGGTSGGSAFVGTIKASVSSTGKPALMFNGRVVKSLKKGRYTVSVSDKSKKAGLVLGMTGMMMKQIAVSSAAKTGSTSKTVTLAAGKWFYAPTAGGKKIYFTVTA